MGRRANNEGSIYQRQDGRWAASLSLGNGKRQHFLGHGWAEVHDKLVGAQKARQDGLPAVTERQTVSQFLTHWQTSTASSRKPRTNIRYEELMRIHTLPELGAMQLTKITPQHIQGLYGVLVRKGLAPSTVHQVHAILHKALKQAVGWGLLVRNSADYVQPPRVPRVETPVLSPEQTRRFLEAAKGSRYEALFVIAVTAGLRQGELLGLRWKDVNLDAGTLEVRQAVQRIKGRWAFVEPKSEKSRRLVALNVLAVDALRRRRLRQNEERLKAGAAWQDLDLVFSSDVGRPVEVSNLTHRYYRPLLKTAGIPQMRFHDLRHSAATLMLGASVDVKVVSEVLGHSQTAFTMDRYQHVSLEMQRLATSAVEALLAEPRH